MLRQSAFALVLVAAECRSLGWLSQEAELGWPHTYLNGQLREVLASLSTRLVHLCLEILEVCAHAVFFLAQIPGGSRGREQAGRQGGRKRGNEGGRWAGRPANRQMDKQAGKQEGS